MRNEQIWEKSLRIWLCFLFDFLPGAHSSFSFVSQEHFYFGFVLHSYCRSPKSEASQGPFVCFPLLLETIVCSVSYLSFSAHSMSEFFLYAMHAKALSSEERPYQHTRVLP